MSPKSTTFIVDKNDIVKFKAKGFAAGFSIGQWMFDNYDACNKAIGLAVFETLGFNLSMKPFYKDSLERGVFIGKSDYNSKGEPIVKRMTRPEWKVVIAACFAVRATLVGVNATSPAMPHNETIPAYLKPETVTDGEYADFSLRG